jgi:hypothetical protein
MGRSARLAAAAGLAAVAASAALWLVHRGPAAPPPAPAAGPAPLAAKPFYRIDAGPGAPCHAATPCEVRLVLTALAGYHVNVEYPFRFVGAPPPAAALARPPGFVHTDASHGTMTVAIAPAAPGTAQLAGTFKLSVCSDDVCEIDTPAIALAVPVR